MCENLKIFPTFFYFLLHPKNYYSHFTGNDSVIHLIICENLEEYMPLGIYSSGFAEVNR